MKSMTKAELTERYDDAQEWIQSLIDGQAEFAEFVETFTTDVQAAVNHATDVVTALGDGSEVCEHELARGLTSVRYALQIASIVLTGIRAQASDFTDLDDDDDCLDLELMSEADLVALADVPMDPADVALVQAELEARAARYVVAPKTSQDTSQVVSMG
jgi:hypothetical protein